MCGGSYGGVFEIGLRGMHFGFYFKDFGVILVSFRTHTMKSFECLASLHKILYISFTTNKPQITSQICPQAKYHPRLNMVFPSPVCRNDPSPHNNDNYSNTLVPKVACQMKY